MCGALREKQHQIKKQTTVLFHTVWLMKWRRMIDEKETGVPCLEFWGWVGKIKGKRIPNKGIQHSKFHQKHPLLLRIPPVHRYFYDDSCGAVPHETRL